ncbi:MAG: threonine--tRNA ligase, partial [Synechococcus sp. SB0663_bin_10]|nr:threonine--tRNA ligase [Synechococcus sp. SB0663_bin_10]
TVDDSHLFVTPEQLDEEFLQVVDLILTVFRDLELRQFKARLSFRGPENTKMIGRPEAWDQAEAAIRRAVDHLGMESVEGPGEAAFYGPKLDFLFCDALEREWQLGTVQVDYNLPERFDLEYVAPDGSRQRPVMLHRAPFGSLERLIGILIEEYGGDLPFWLAPEQIRILPVTAAAFTAAQRLATRLCSHGVRATVAVSGERLGKLIRNGETRKIPVLGILGEQEMEADSVSLRTRRQGNLGAMAQARLVELAREAVAGRRATLMP